MKYEASEAKADPRSEAYKNEIKRYLERHAKMKARRSATESHWQECMDYIVPRKGDVTSSSPEGSRRNDELFDTTAIMANQMLAAALHGMLTNPTTRFFDLIMGDPALDEDEEVKLWLQIVSDRMFIVMNGSNFQTEVHEIYIDEGAIGTACMFMGEHPEKIVHFNARAMKEIYVDENNLGLIDTVHREFSWKPKHIVQEFGLENLPEFVVKKYEEGCDDDWKIIHCVHPMDENDEYSKAGLHKFKSTYILMEQGLFLSRSGFRESPYAVPRWTKTSGEIYGRGPGMEMLPDIKMVNKMMETTISGAQLTIKPPLQVDDDGVLGRVRLTPGGVSVTRPGSTIKPIMLDSRIDFGVQMVEDTRKRIRAGFYTDKIQLNDGPQKTATEVSQIADEQWRFMGPVVGRQHFEFLKPVIERVFGIMSRKEGLLPPAPKKIQGKAFDVRYSSLAARAQRMSEGQDLNRAIAAVAPIVNAIPETMDNFNGDRAFNYVMGIHGIPQKVMSTDREKADIREGRAKAQQAAAKQAQEAHAAEMAGKTMPGAAQLMQASQQPKGQA